MTEIKNILLVGVGGQGIILASKILSKGLIDSGYDVKMSEVHGMAQRGGSVTTQVRFGEKVYSPIIGIGQADAIVAFEKMEAMRWIEYLKPDGKLVVNNYVIPSALVLTGKVEYPKEIIEELQEKVSTTIVDGANIAREIGDIRSQNIVMLGALVKALGLESINWEKVLSELVKDRFVEMNSKAFSRGMELVK